MGQAFILGQRSKDIRGTMCQAGDHVTRLCLLLVLLRAVGSQAHMASFGIHVVALLITFLGAVVIFIAFASRAR